MARKSAITKYINKAGVVESRNFSRFIFPPLELLTFYGVHIEIVLEVNFW